MSGEINILDVLGKEVGCLLGDGPPPERLAEQRRDFLSYVENKNFKKRNYTRPLVAAAALAAAVVAVFLWQWSTGPLDFWIGDESNRGAEGNWVETKLGEELPIHFAEGSTLELGSDTATKVVEATRKHVHIDLRRGQLSAKIKPHRSTHWLVDTGPYQVEVTGTIFDVSWDVEQSVLSVFVTRGEVVVRGAGLTANGIRVAKGDLLQVDRKDASYSLQSGQREMPRKIPSQIAAPMTKSSEAESVLESNELLDESRLEVSTLRDAETRRADDRGDRRAGRASGHRKMARRAETDQSNWQSYYDKKQYSMVVKAAREEGIEELLRTSDVEDLWRLASAARYARQGRIATEALLTIRERFPGTKRADTATFLLGRVMLELKYDIFGAQNWFKTYLKENAEGPLVEEALGRLVDACEKGGRVQEAKLYARSYLKKYPRGVFAELARSVLDK